MVVKRILLKILSRLDKFLYDNDSYSYLHSFILKQNVKIGKDSRLYKNCLIINMQGRESISIGSNCNIKGELLTYPYGSGISIGNNTYIGKGSIIRSANRIEIGNNVLIAHNVTVIDTDSHEFDYLERAEGYLKILKFGHSYQQDKILTSPIIINDYAWISYNVSILKGVTIGKGAIVGAGAVVTKDVPDFTVVVGNPARVIKKLK